MKVTKLCRYSASSLASLALLLSSPMPASAQIAEADTGEFRRIEQPLGLKLGVTAAGLGLIGLELWWFFANKPRASSASSEGSDAGSS
ncbi:MAG: hypothetical protein F6J97_22360 [Leptolyngbya sp. SIO4C1]|nr:hypothetical protein [Leptolyngbya sp. SIO4C1]